MPASNVPVPDVTVREDDARRPAVAALLAELDAYLARLYPGDVNTLLSIEALQRPGITLLTAECEGCLAGCGAFVDESGEYADIKRMYVVPAYRGRRIAQRLLAELERRACNSGLSLARLETGVSQPEAIRLYERAGYRRRGVYGAYADADVSIFMEKRLIPA